MHHQFLPLFYVLGLDILRWQHVAFPVHIYDQFRTKSTPDSTYFDDPRFKCSSLFYIVHLSIYWRQNIARLLYLTIISVQRSSIGILKPAFFSIHKNTLHLNQNALAHISSNRSCSNWKFFYHLQITAVGMKFFLKRHYPPFLYFVLTIGTELLDAAHSIALSVSPQNSIMMLLLCFFSFSSIVQYGFETYS